MGPLGILDALGRVKECLIEVLSRSSKTLDDEEKNDEVGRGFPKNFGQEQRSDEDGDSL